MSVSRPRGSAAGGCPVFGRCCLHPPPPDAELELHPSVVLRRRSDATYSPSEAAPVRTPRLTDSPAAAPPEQATASDVSVPAARVYQQHIVWVKIIHFLIID